jgi:hypothetical protein
VKRLPSMIALGLASLLAAVAAGAVLAGSALGLRDANTTSLQARSPVRDRAGENHLIRHLPRGDESPRVFKRRARRLAGERGLVPRKIMVFRPVLDRTRAGRTRITFRRDVDGGGFPTVPGLLGYSFGNQGDLQACAPGGQFVPVSGNGANFSDYGLADSCTPNVGMEGQFVVQPGLTYGAPWSGYFGWGTSAPPGVTIDSVTGSFDVTNAGASQIADYGGDGWFGETYSNGFPQTELTNFANADDAGVIETDINNTVNGSSWAWLFTCGVQPYCGGDISGEMTTATMYATETAHPAVSESSALTSRTGWLWNPAGDPWPLSVAASDPSGVCALTATLAGKALVATAGTSDPTSQWMICRDASANTGVDLNALSTGTQTLTTSAENGAFLTSSQSQTVHVDDMPVSVALSTSNDTNPTLWVNHPVTVTQTTTAGPSGVGGTNCRIDNNPVFLASGPFTVDGTGSHVVSCTGWDQATNPQGQNRTGGSSETINIDETPPSIAIEPQNPASPAQVVVDTTDAQSGVAGGSIQIAPAGTTHWTNVPTSLATGHLIGEINDAQLSGAYTIQATSCDQVGNCSSTGEQLTLPLRAAVSSQVGWEKLIAPTKIITKRVRVGYRIGHARYHGHRVTVKVGGRKRTIKIVVARNHRCAHKRVKIGHHHWRVINVCRHVKVIRRTQHRVLHGRSTKLYGLVSAGGVPVADALVEIRTAPNSLGHHWRRIAIVTADGQGQWSYKLKPGPSRLIRAFYPGSARLHPDTGTATTIVPAKIKLHITPTTLPWSHQITISGRLVGGYVPKKGVVLRFVWVQNKHNHPAKFSFRTDGRGRFRTTFTWGQGTGVQTEDWSVWTYGTDSAYPWSSGRAPKVAVTWGPQTPASMLRPPHHHRKHHHHRRRHAH